MKTLLTNKEVERGEILRYLAEAYPGVATFSGIINYLDYAAYSTTKEDVEFHLEYLMGKGFIEIEEHPRVAGHLRKIRAIKITPAGIDLLDRRAVGDSGVR